MGNKTVQLLVPCLVDQLYPEIGIASVNILRHFGYRVRYSPEFVCCGQPAFNAGHRKEARAVAMRCLGSLASARDIDSFVCPSGSCTAMIRKFFPELFRDDADARESLPSVISRTYELSEFLVNEGIQVEPPEKPAHKIGFHNSCHSYRELKLKLEGKRSLCDLGHFTVEEPTKEPSCCGFGGLFSVKYEGISSAMAKSRLEQFLEQNMNEIVTNDPGCIMHLRSEVSRHGYDVAVDHVSVAIAKRLNLPIESLNAEQP